MSKYHKTYIELFRLGVQEGTHMGFAFEMIFDAKGEAPCKGQG